MNNIQAEQEAIDNEHDIANQDIDESINEIIDILKDYINNPKDIKGTICDFNNVIDNIDDDLDTAGYTEGIEHSLDDNVDNALYNAKSDLEEHQDIDTLKNDLEDVKDSKLPTDNNNWFVGNYWN